MKEPVTFIHGDEEITARQHNDGKLNCPQCAESNTFNGVDALRIHLSSAHNIRHHQTRVCEHCGEEFRTRQYTDQRFCSPECSGESYNTGDNSCRLCGTFLSEDHEGEHCDKCAKLVAFGEQMDSVDESELSGHSKVAGGD